MKEQKDKSHADISVSQRDLPEGSENGVDAADIEKVEGGVKETPNTDQIMSGEAPLEKRKRGRPRKHPKPEGAKEGGEGKETQKRKRGRPRKHPKSDGDNDRSDVTQKKRGRPRKHPKPVEGKDGIGEKQPKKKEKSP